MHNLATLIISDMWLKSMWFVKLHKCWLQLLRLFEIRTSEKFSVLGVYSWNQRRELLRDKYSECDKKKRIIALVEGFCKAENVVDVEGPDSTHPRKFFLDFSLFYSVFSHLLKAFNVLLALCWTIFFSNCLAALLYFFLSLLRS